MPAKIQPLRIRKLADRTAPREVRFNSQTGQKFLVDPATGKASPRPFLGLEFVGKVPKRTRVSQTFVARGRSEGWIEVEDENIVQRSSGPPEDPVSNLNPPHIFTHLGAVVFKTVDGDVRYKVKRNPDKWPDRKEKSEVLADHGFGGKVDHTYELVLDG